MQEFISKRGVTPCPSFGTPEFREMNIAREKARTDENHRAGGRWAKSRAVKLKKALRA